MEHKNTQPLYIFNRENPQNSEPQNGPRRGLDFIALVSCTKIQLPVGYKLLNFADKTHLGHFHKRNITQWV